MKKTYLYALIAILYLLTPVCAIATLGAMVSMKYEVDEGYFFIDRNKTLTQKERANAIQLLEDKRDQLTIQASLLAFGACATFVTATVLIIKRRSLLQG